MQSATITLRSSGAISFHLLMLITLSLIAFTAGEARAADPVLPPPPAAVPTTTQAPVTPLLPAPVTPPLVEVKVKDAYRLGWAYGEGTLSRNSAAIGDIIVIRVDKLDNLVKTSKCLSADEKTVLTCQKRDIALFLDGREIKGIQPESGAPRPDAETLQFHLQRSPDSDEAWADLLGAPPFGGAKFTHRATEVSVGLKDAYALPTSVSGDSFKLVRIRGTRFVVCTILLIVVVFMLIILALFTEMLRDLGEKPPTDASRKWWQQAHKPYSLARFQMAVWFFLIVTSLLFIWQITGAYDIINSTALGLIGIGAGTALGAAAVDAGKNQANGSRLEALKAEKATLNADIMALDAQIIVAPPPANLAELQQTKTAKQTRPNLVSTQIGELSVAVAAKTSKNFLSDILTDGDDGISFHRFQIFVWTLVLAIIFIYGVWYRLAMPEFSATLLALLGISSGTYLGFKIPEKQT